MTHLKTNNTHKSEPKHVFLFGQSMTMAELRAASNGKGDGEMFYCFNLSHHDSLLCCLSFFLFFFSLACPHRSLSSRFTQISIRPPSSIEMITFCNTKRLRTHISSVKTSETMHLGFRMFVCCFIKKRKKDRNINKCWQIAGHRFLVMCLG